MAYSVSVVNYLNSQPFIFGLEQFTFSAGINISKDIPSVCGEKLAKGEVDLGLVPVAILPHIPDYTIVSDYCIGAVGAVRSVMLYSHVPLHEINEILLDYQSITSVNLVRILAREYWKIRPLWVNATSGFEKKISGATAGVIIGDRTFALEGEFPFVYDLSEHWTKYTGLPFVFACWASNKSLEPTFIQEFKDALTYGLQHREFLAQQLRESGRYPFANIPEYLNESISYSLDAAKKKGLELFLHYLAANRTGE